MKQGKNSDDIRRRNRGLVLKLIATGKAISRVDIAGQIGLTKMAVTKIVSELLSDGILEEGPPIDAPLGRRATALRIGGRSPLVLGLYLSRERLTGILCDASLRVVEERLLLLATETEHTLADRMTALCQELLSHTDRPVWGIGVSAIGPLDMIHGRMVHPPHFFEIEELPIRDILSRQFPYPVTVLGDMGAAALAELRFGRGQGLESFLYVGLTNGVGSGVVYDGRLYTGSSGFSSELGHIGVDIQGGMCGCGRRGCVELYANIPVLMRKLSDASGLKQSFAEYCALETEKVADVLEEMLPPLAYAIASQVNMLGPQAVFIGHDGSFLPKWVFEKLEASVNRQKLWGKHNHVSVQPAALAEKAPLLGSVCGFLENLFTGEYGLKTEG